MYITTGCVVLPGNLHRDCHGRRLLCFILLMRYLFLSKEGGGLLLTSREQEQARLHVSIEHRGKCQSPSLQFAPFLVPALMSTMYNKAVAHLSVHVHASAPFDHAQHVWETSHSLSSAKQEGPEATNALVLYVELMGAPS